MNSIKKIWINLSKREKKRISSINFLLMKLLKEKLNIYKMLTTSSTDITAAKFLQEKEKIENNIAAQ